LKETHSVEVVKEEANIPEEESATFITG